MVTRNIFTYIECMIDHGSDINKSLWTGEDIGFNAMIVGLHDVTSSANNNLKTAVQRFLPKIIDREKNLSLTKSKSSVLYMQNA